MKKKGPTKAKKDWNGAYKGQNEGNKTFKKFAPQISENA